MVGFEVVPSKNHPEPDICDDLKGKYPKTFDFSGWHPHCRCHTEPIMKTVEEMERDNAAILAGGEPSAVSVNTVGGVPSGFLEWVKLNGAKIGAAKSLPYFVRDNRKLVDGILNPAPSAALLEEWNDKAVLHYGANLLRVMGGVYEETQPLADAIKRGNVETVMAEAAKLKALGKEIMSMDIFENPLAMVRKFPVDGVIHTINFLRQWFPPGASAFLSNDPKIMKLTEKVRYLRNDKTRRLPRVHGLASDLLEEELRRMTAAPVQTVENAKTTTSVNQAIAEARHSKRTQEYYEDVHYRWALYQMRTKNWGDFKANTTPFSKELASYRGTKEEFETMLRECFDSYNAEAIKSKRLSSDFIDAVISRQLELFAADSLKLLKFQGCRTNMRRLIDSRLSEKIPLDSWGLLTSPKSSFDFIVMRSRLKQEDIKRLRKMETEAESIAAIAGGDKTVGSCASVAQAFAGRNFGYKVLDYRGGDSQMVHGLDYGYGYYADLGRFHESSTEKIFAHLKDSLQVGEKYLLTTNKHCSVVKKVPNGKIYYLELQSATNNGWKELTGIGMMKWRFGQCPTNQYQQLISFTDLAKNFDKLARNLETIHNTGKQMKDITGQIR